MCGSAEEAHLNSELSVGARSQREGFGRFDVGEPNNGYGSSPIDYRDRRLVAGAVDGLHYTDGFGKWVLWIVGYTKTEGDLAA